MPRQPVQNELDIMWELRRWVDNYLSGGSIEVITTSSSIPPL
jgi:hypothetical protein